MSRRIAIVAAADERTQAIHDHRTIRRARPKTSSPPIPTSRTIQVILTDADGVGRGKSVRRNELARIYTHGRYLPGSILGLDITGADVEETGLVWEDGDADRACWPIPGTLVRSPWQVPAAGQLLVSMYELDGTPSPGDPRHALKRVVDRFAELESDPRHRHRARVLPARSRARRQRPRPPPASPVSGIGRARLQAYLLTDLDDLGPFLADVYAACETQGLPVQTLISEYAPGQLEIVLHHRADALRAVDDAIMYKRLVRGVAAQPRHGRHLHGQALLPAIPAAACTCI